MQSCTARLHKNGNQEREASRDEKSARKQNSKSQTVPKILLVSCERERGGVTVYGILVFLAYRDGGACDAERRERRCYFPRTRLDSEPVNDCQSADL